jgi:hypothetical protein
VCVGLNSFKALRNINLRRISQMSKFGSIKYQLKQRVQSKIRLGEKRNKVKKEIREECKMNGSRMHPTRTAGIFSVNTLKTYIRIGNLFAEWCIENYKVKTIDEITKEMALKYLQMRKDKGQSAWTLQTVKSSINKLFEFNINVDSKDIDLPKRKRENIKRSRGERAHDKQVNLENYKDLITILRGFGFRRREAKKLKVDSIIKISGRLYALILKGASGGGKGGKYREVECLKYMEKEVEEVVAKRLADEKLFVFDKIPGKLDVHSIRADYANEKYKELLENTEIASTEEIYTRNDGKKYNVAALKKVSENLGHNRISVVITNYMR